MVFGTVVLIVAAFVVSSLSAYLTLYRPLLAQFTSSEMTSASDRVADNVKALFARVEMIAARERAWGQLGLLDTDNLEALNKFSGPRFTNDVSVTSMAIAEDTGREVLIYSPSPNGWLNRLTDPAHWGTRARILTWSPQAKLLKSEDETVDYDARLRPWFKAAMAMPSDGDTYWMPPYRFVSTQALGISAVVRWTAADGHKYVMTTDVTLMDLSRLAEQIGVVKSGIAAILTADGRILAASTNGASRETVTPLEDIDGLKASPLKAGYDAWRNAGRPARKVVKFASDGTAWLATFEPIHLAQQTFWVVSLAPSVDFAEVSGPLVGVGAAAILASILIACFTAVWLGGHFSKPIEQLTAESARIGRMDLDHPIATDSAVHEIAVLAGSLEKMRLDLAQAQSETKVRAELERQLAQAQRTEAIGRLAGGVAHDFNNLLSAIIGFAGFLVEDLAKGTPQHRFAERIVHAGERGKEIARQILAFSRSTSLERAHQDLARVVLDTEALLRAALPSSTVLEVKIEAHDVFADVNLGEVSQILLNLCLNANDALDGQPGRVSVRLSRTDPGDVDHAYFAATAPHEGWTCGGALESGQAYARITIADTGSGIEPALLERIFDPFFTTKARSGGTGLGLSVVQTVVQSYRGAYTVTSRPGSGTAFAIYLPLCANTSASPASEPPQSQLEGNERILIVDDEKEIADMLKIGFERLGYEAVIRNDPEEALALFAGDPGAFDVVISDQVMPKMKGLTLFDRLKALDPTVRFVLCSGFSEGTTEEGALAAGVGAFLLKPVSPESLALAVRRLIDGRAEVGVE